MTSTVISARVEEEEKRQIEILLSIEKLSLRELIMDAVNARVPRDQDAKTYFANRMRDQLKDMEAQYQLDSTALLRTYESSRVLFEKRLQNLQSFEERRISRIMELLPRFLQDHETTPSWGNSTVEWFKAFNVLVTHEELHRIRLEWGKKATSTPEAIG